MNPVKKTTAPEPNQDDDNLQEFDKNMEIKLEQEILTSLIEADPETILKTENTKSVSPDQLNTIIERLSAIKGISRGTTIVGMSTLFMKGASNAGAPDTMEVELYCPHKKVTIILTRYDIATTMEIVVKHKTVRKLAETMAPQIIEASLKKLEKYPMVDLRGDLANRIDRKLSIRNQPELTRKEKICAATYAQWMPNLNALAESDRLAGLLNEDLNARRKKNARGKVIKAQAPKAAPAAGKKQNKKK